jgi:hypothetical protein
MPNIPTTDSNKKSEYMTINMSIEQSWTIVHMLFAIKPIGFKISQDTINST